MGNDVVGTAQRRFDSLLIEVFQGLTMETAMLYEDDGQTNDYVDVSNFNLFNMSYTRDSSNFNFTMQSVVNNYDPMTRHIAIKVLASYPPS